MASTEEDIVEPSLLPKTKSFKLPPGVKPAPPKGLPPSRRESKQTPPTPLRVLGPDGDRIMALRPEGPDGTTMERSLRPTSSFVRRPEPPKPPPGLRPGSGASPPQSPGGTLVPSRPPGLGGDPKPPGLGDKPPGLGNKTKSKVDVLGSLLRGQSALHDSDNEIEVGGDYADNSTDEDEEEEDEEEPQQPPSQRHTLVIRPPTMPPPGNPAARQQPMAPRTASQAALVKPAPPPGKAALSTGIASGTVAQMQSKVAATLGGGGGSSKALPVATEKPAVQSGLVAQMQGKVGGLLAGGGGAATTSSAPPAASSTGIVAQMSGKVASQIATTGVISATPRAPPVQVAAAYEDPVPEPMGSPQGLVPPASSAPPAAESEWVVMWSPEYSRNYWFNRNTGVSTWEDPGAVAAPAMAQQMLLQQQQQQQSYHQQQSVMAFRQQQHEAARSRGNTATGHDEERDVFGRPAGSDARSGGGSGSSRPMSLRATFSRMLGGGRSSPAHGGSGSSKGSGGSDPNVEIALPVSSKEHIVAVDETRAKHGIEIVAEVQTKSGRHTIVRAKPKRRGKDRSTHQPQAAAGYYAHESGHAPATYVRALYEFVPADPTNAMELPLSPGDVIQVYEQGQDGWWGGTRVSDGRQGLFPAAFVQYAA